MKKSKRTLMFENLEGKILLSGLVVQPSTAVTVLYDPPPKPHVVISPMDPVAGAGSKSTIPTSLPIGVGDHPIPPYITTPLA